MYMHYIALKNLHVDAKKKKIRKLVPDEDESREKRHECKGPQKIQRGTTQKNQPPQ